MYGIAYSKSAINSLKRMPAKERRRIHAAIAAYAAKPEARSHQTRKLRGRDAYRLRVGTWRAIFDLDDGTMRILQVGARGSIYS